MIVVRVGGSLGQDPGVDLVHGGEIGLVLQVHRHRRDLPHARLVPGQQRGEVVEHPGRLDADVAGDDGAGRVDGQHAGDVDETAGGHRGAERRGQCGRLRPGGGRQDDPDGDGEKQGGDSHGHLGGGAGPRFIRYNARRAVHVPKDMRIIHYFYLHGFASSPESGKAEYLRRRLAPLGIPLHAPDFNEPQFSTLTVSRMLEQVRSAIEALPAGPVGLIGSSLGGFVAIHAAASQPAGTSHPIARMVLLAPAVDFASGRDGWLTAAELEHWRTTGWRDVFHHARGRSIPLHYALYEDGHRFDAFATRFDTPALVLQGTEDAVVNPRRVMEWAAPRPNVAMRMLQDDHRLEAHIDTIWTESAAFLGIPGE